MKRSPAKRQFRTPTWDEQQKAKAVELKMFKVKLDIELRAAGIDTSTLEVVDTNVGPWLGLGGTEAAPMGTRSIEEVPPLCILAGVVTDNSGEPKLDSRGKLVMSFTVHWPKWKPDMGQWLYGELLNSPSTDTDYVCRLIVRAIKWEQQGNEVKVKS